MQLIAARGMQGVTITWSSRRRNNGSWGPDDNCFSLTTSEVLVILGRGQATQQRSQLCFPGYPAVHTILLCRLWVCSGTIASWELVPPSDLGYNILYLHLHARIGYVNVNYIALSMHQECNAAGCAPL